MRSGSASQESGERELSSSDSQPGGERDPAGIRVSVIKTNKRRQPEPEAIRLLRFLVHYNVT